MSGPKEPIRASFGAGGAEVGIVVLNYHHPVETMACIRSLLAAEGPEARILWIENDARATGPGLQEALASADFPWTWLREDDPLPRAGTVGILRNDVNLGYAGGNNVGLRFLHRHGVPFAWVLNNDTELVQGSSRELRACAQARQEIGAWGTRIETDTGHYFGGIVDPLIQSVGFCRDIAALERDPNAFVSGCSLFFRVEVAAALGFLPEHYFLYYEDPAFGLELRRRGLGLSATEAVRIKHIESLSTGRRSMLMEYYNKRNRWHFMRAYFPQRLRANRWRLLYDLQKYLLRLRLRRAYVEWTGYRDFRRGLTGPTHRAFSRFQST